jgi:hypothetical protein
MEQSSKVRGDLHQTNLKQGHLSLKKYGQAFEQTNSHLSPQAIVPRCNCAHGLSVKHHLSMIKKALLDPYCLHDPI